MKTREVESKGGEGGYPSRLFLWFLALLTSCLPSFACPTRCFFDQCIGRSTVLRMLEKGGLSLRGVAFMTVLAVLTVLAVVLNPLNSTPLFRHPEVPQLINNDPKSAQWQLVATSWDQKGHIGD